MPVRCYTAGAGRERAVYPDHADGPPVLARPYLAAEEREECAPRRLDVAGDLDVATARALAERLDHMQEDRVDVRP